VSRERAGAIAFLGYVLVFTVLALARHLGSGEGVAPVKAEELGEPYRTLYRVQLDLARTGAPLDVAALHEIFLDPRGIPAKRRRASFAPFRQKLGTLRGTVSEVDPIFWGGIDLVVMTRGGALVTAHFSRRFEEALLALKEGEEVQVSGTLGKRLEDPLEECRLESRGERGSG
jgi:hypothetical protein